LSEQYSGFQVARYAIHRTAETGTAGLFDNARKDPFRLVGAYLGTKLTEEAIDLSGLGVEEAR